jgi:hypothetical protein
MKQLIIYISLLAGILFIQSCQEVFNPDNLNSNDKIPVIEGYINLGEGPHQVTLSWANAFGSFSFVGITGANVSITDQLGNSTLLSEVRPGVYETKTGQLNGVAGNTYTLHVVFSDGTTFESDPEVLADVPVLDSINYEFGNKDDYTYDSDGTLHIINNKGLFLYGNTSVSLSKSVFYTYSTKLITETTRLKQKSNGVSIMPYTIYYWSIDQLDVLPNITASTYSDNKQIIKDHQLCFLPFLASYGVANDSISAASFAGWIVCTTITSISAENYAYTKAKREQLSANNYIFDPVSTQLPTNLKCTSNSEIVPVGFFEAKSIKKCYNWYYATSGSKTVRHYENSNFVDTLETDGSSQSMPGFWNFNSIKINPKYN